MPMYEYYCPSCKTKFDRLRPMNAEDGAVQCPAGHTGARRLVSVFAMGGRGAEPIPAGGGGCCGGGCACGR
jgi:putative FmdB family regulatory protein